jgi:limonene-1,2-epoxide hydrolase
MKRYLNLGVVDCSSVPVTQDEKKQLNTQDINYPNTGIVRWKSTEQMLASLQHINDYIRINHFQFLQVPRYTHKILTERLYRDEFQDEFHSVGNTTVVHISNDLTAVRLWCTHANSRIFLVNNLHMNADGSVFMCNMIKLTVGDHGVAVIFFEDIMNTIIRYRQDQMYAMLLATKERQDNALKRATKHSLWEPQLLRLVGQII